MKSKLRSQSKMGIWTHCMVSVRDVQDAIAVPEDPLHWFAEFRPERRRLKSGSAHLLTKYTHSLFRDVTLRTPLSNHWKNHSLNYKRNITVFPQLLRLFWTLHHFLWTNPNFSTPSSWNLCVSGRPGHVTSSTSLQMFPYHSRETRTPWLILAEFFVGGKMLTSADFRISVPVPLTAVLVRLCQNISRL